MFWYWLWICCVIRIIIHIFWTIRTWNRSQIVRCNRSRGQERGACIFNTSTCPRSLTRCSILPHHLFVSSCSNTYHKLCSVTFIYIHITWFMALRWSNRRFFNQFYWWNNYGLSRSRNNLRSWHNRLHLIKKVRHHL